MPSRHLSKWHLHKGATGLFIQRVQPACRKRNNFLHKKKQEQGDQLTQASIPNFDIVFIGLLLIYKYINKHIDKLI